MTNKTKLPVSVSEKAQKKFLKEYKGMIDVCEELKETIDWLPEGDKAKKIKTLLKPIHINPTLYSCLMASLLLKSRCELKKLLKDKDLPIMVRVFIGTIGRASRNSALFQMVLNIAANKFETVQPHFDFSDRSDKRAILVIRDPKDYDEKEVMDHQRKLKEITIDDYKKLAEPDKKKPRV